ARIKNAAPQTMRSGVTRLAACHEQAQLACHEQAQLACHERSAASRMEAGGIEPPSRNDPNGSLYMLSLVFCCRSSQRSPTTCASRQPSFSRPFTNGRMNEPACCFSAGASQATRRAEACL